MINTTETGRYYSYPRFLKEKFGMRVYKVSVDAGFTCPNIDGKVAVGGCTFCNNNTFTPPMADRRTSVHEQIRRGIEFYKKRYNARKFVVYFQSYTNTYAPLDELDPLWVSALEHDEVIGLTIGTRPDCIDLEKLSVLEQMAKNHFIAIEYGVQSIYDQSLKLINRGHDYQCFLDAVELTRHRNIYICGHVILGLPNESREQMLAMADEMSRLRLDFLKIHHLQIVKGTAMARDYQRAPFETLSYEVYLELISDFIERVSPAVVLQRLFAESPHSFLIAPRWNRSTKDIHRDIDRVLEQRGSYQGLRYFGGK